MATIHDPESGLLPRYQMDLASRVSKSDESFRRKAAHRPLIIQKVPPSVRDSLEERYFVPDVVSIGPYHHRAKPHLVEMEEVKEAVAHQFCRAALQDDTAAVSRFLDVVTPVLPDARSYYADRFDHITNNDFDYMMVVDGCFLLAVMAILARKYPQGLEHSSWTHGRMLRIMKDILLFENQIPWAVMRRLIALWRVPVVDEFVSRVLAYFDFDVHISQHNKRRHASTSTPPPAGMSTAWEWDDDRLSPVHLLDLVYQRHLGLGGPAPEANGGAIRYCDYARPFAHFTSAVELAEAGIHLHRSGTCRVKDVRVEPLLPAAATLRLRIGHLVLPQLSLSWLPRCWLINMVALECVTDRSDRSGVSSYLAILGSLVRGERDVEELRSRRILFSTMSDRRTVEFFEGLLDPLPRQELYLRTLEEIVRLRSRRSIRSGIHAVYYRNRRIILAAAPLLSLLVAIIGIVVTNSIKHSK